jgi:hypothetical protein
LLRWRGKRLVEFLILPGDDYVGGGEEELIMDYIGSSIQEVQPRRGAPMTAALLKKLKDLDANRIASNDAVVMHKAVLALLAVVSDLESRINALEASSTTNGAVRDA